jgi:hypothetical protein
MADLYWYSGSLRDSGPGLKILAPVDIEISDPYTGKWVRTIQAPTYEDFQQQVKSCLDLLYKTETGSKVLDVLAEKTNCTIGFSQNNKAGARNMQAAMTLPAYEILRGGAPGNESFGAMMRGFAMNSNDQTIASENLAIAINLQPRWRLDQSPGAAGGRMTELQSLRDYVNRWIMWSYDPTEGYFDKQRLFRTLGCSSAGLNMTAQETLQWMKGNIPARLSNQNKEQLKLATVVALEPYSARGAGSPSDIGFSTGSHDEYRNLRPPAIALGHELIHAYFSLQGIQPGVELNHFSTVLFEFKCVGLGPWDEEKLSENGLRKQWTRAILANADTDPYNRRIPGKRIRY